MGPCSFTWQPSKQTFFHRSSFPVAVSFYSIITVPDKSFSPGTSGDHTAAIEARDVAVTCKHDTPSASVYPLTGAAQSHKGKHPPRPSGSHAHTSAIYSPMTTAASAAPAYHECTTAWSNTIDTCDYSNLLYLIVQRRAHLHVEAACLPVKSPQAC